MRKRLKYRKIKQLVEWLCKYLGNRALQVAEIMSDVIYSTSDVVFPTSDVVFLMSNVNSGVLWEERPIMVLQ